MFGYVRVPHTEGVHPSVVVDVKKSFGFRRVDDKDGCNDLERL